MSRVSLLFGFCFLIYSSMQGGLPHALAQIPEPKLQKPEIVSAGFDTKRIEYEGVATWKVVVKSDLPITVLHYELQSPLRSKKLDNGPRKVRLTKTGPGTYEFEERLKPTKSPAIPSSPKGERAIPRPRRGPQSIAGG